ncbi:MAG: quinone-dependent dihydroorotate dehydrogenase [Epsilonproteobacteria bacterium]|nr:quinone-dependent dihydroorotate dehydrogenase [Campylobacterota bacterium]
MYEYIKKIMFLLDPENAHNLAEFSLKNGYKACPFAFSKYAEKHFVEDKTLHQEIEGIRFVNPVGLAAGFDKNATMIKPLTSLGFGHIEYGTLTPKPQSGNPKPRLFRYPEFNSIQNAMGFNNDGADKISKRVRKIYPFAVPLGANIGKNKTTPLENAIDDYSILIDRFKELCDYFVINISSPNTKGLRDLQNEEFIKSIFEMGISKTNKPIFLKLAPDMPTQNAVKLALVAKNSGAKGIIATNTTIDYSLLPNSKDFGGISGEVLKEKSYNFFKELAKELFGKITLISVGGIDSSQEAYKRIKAGASLVQVYSSLIFKGPALLEEINKGLIELLKKDGYTHIGDAVGADLKGGQ